MDDGALAEFVAGSFFFFLRGDGMGSFVRFRFCAFSLEDPRELSQDLALLPAVRVSEASSLGFDFLRGVGTLDWWGFKVNV